MFIKMDDTTKHTLEEISALSGIQRDMIREVWEFTLISWIEKITKDPTKINTFQVPFLGSVGIRYVNDQLNEEGKLETNVDIFVNASSFFKTLVGDVYDNKQGVITDILQKKINNAISNVVNESD